MDQVCSRREFQSTRLPTARIPIHQIKFLPTARIPIHQITHGPNSNPPDYPRPEFQSTRLSTARIPIHRFTHGPNSNPSVYPQSDGQSIISSAPRPFTTYARYPLHGARPFVSRDVTSRCAFVLLCIMIFGSPPSATLAAAMSLSDIYWLPVGSLASSDLYSLF